jgi:RNA recognition motif-containing protein
LSQAFGRIGELRDVYIPRDYHSNQPRGFAFIEFAEPRQAREAREEMDRFLMKGRELEVVFAQERRKTPVEMKGRVVNIQSREDTGRGEGEGRDRSSSFERHKQQKKEEGSPPGGSAKNEVEF